MGNDSKKGLGVTAKERLDAQYKTELAEKLKVDSPTPAPAGQPTLEDQVVQKIAKDLLDDFYK